MELSTNRRKNTIQIDKSRKSSLSFYFRAEVTARGYCYNIRTGSCGRISVSRNVGGKDDLHFKYV